MSQSSDAAILVLNSGSSSLKAGMFVPAQGGNFANEREILTAQASGIGQGGGKLSIHDEVGEELAAQDHPLGSQEEALTAIANAIQQHGGGIKPVAVGHRLVHGGPRLREHTLLTGEVKKTLEASVHYAPLHLPSALRIIDGAEKLFPDAAQVACFDTTFHRNMPEVAKRLPIPARYAEQGVERYGFHGLSYESIVGQLGFEGSVPERVIMAHLGSGSSLCAALRGVSIDTSMGFTPTGGIPMATRTGDLDPGVLFFIARASNLSIDALEKLVNHEAGIAAVTGGSGDMQALEAVLTSPGHSAAEKEAAALGMDIFTTAIAKEIASLTVSLGGLDLLVFTGGIGEHSAAVRAAATARLRHLGFRMDPDANASNATRLGSSTGRVDIRILPAEEDLTIARHTRHLLAAT